MRWGGGVEKPTGEGESRNNSKMKEGFLSFFPHNFSPFICHLLCVPCQQLECCMDAGGEKGEVAERENV